MKTQKWWGAVLVVALVLVGVWWWRRDGGMDEKPAAEEAMELEGKVNEYLQDQGLVLPEGVERANLKDVGGKEATGVATRRKIDSKTEYTIIASLPDLEEGNYEGWLTDENGLEPVNLGKLMISKGGYLLEIVTQKDMSGKNRVIVTLNKGELEGPGLTMLEGKFE